MLRATLALLTLLAAACSPDKEPDVSAGTSGDAGTSLDSTLGMSSDPTTPATTASTPTTGEVDSSGEVGDMSTGAPRLDIGGGGGAIDGVFLLAVASVLDPSLPFQFLASVERSGDGTLLKLDLQPLSLDPSKVVTPREPVGEPLHFTDIAIVGTGFTADLGGVQIQGAANPITAADILAALTLHANIESDDFFCGTVTGEVLEPPIGSIDGSTFAALRVGADVMLPVDVTINCEGKTVTDF